MTDVVIYSLTGHTNPTDILTLADGQALFPRVVTPQQYGAVADGVTDDSAAVQAAASALGTAGGGVVKCNGRFLIATNVTLPDNVHLVGDLVLPGEKLPATSAVYSDSASVLIVDSSVTITTGDSSGVHGLIVIRRGLALPFPDAATATTGVAAFAGTALTVGGADSYFAHLLILGFNQAIFSTGHERVRCEFVQGDCTNGISINNCTDIPRLRGCHFWEFTTTHQSWTTNALITRTGTAYNFTSVGDWNAVTECFAFGYANGFVVDSCDHTNFIGCGADYPNALASTSVGFTFQGTAREGLLLGCQAAAQGTGVLVNTTAGTGAVVTINGGNFWNCDTNYIHVQQGRAVVTGGTRISGTGVGVQIDSTSLGALVVGNTFDGLTTPIAATGTGYERSIIGPNQYINCVDTLGPRRLYDNQTATNYESAYSANVNGYTLHARQARGSVSAPTISQANDGAWRVFGDVYDGSTFSPIAAIRMIADVAPSAGATPGKLVFSTTAAGASSVTDRWVLDKAGALFPVADNAYSIGTSAARMSSVFSYGTNIAEVAAASVPTPGASTQTLFIDTADHKLKRKDSSGAVTIIA